MLSAIVLAAIVLVGCGSSNATGSVSTSTSTTSSAVEQGWYNCDPTPHDTLPVHKSSSHGLAVGSAKLGISPTMKSVTLVQNAKSCTRDVVGNFVTVQVAKTHGGYNYDWATQSGVDVREAYLVLSNQKGQKLCSVKPKIRHGVFGFNTATNQCFKAHRSATNIMKVKLNFMNANIQSESVTSDIYEYWYPKVN